MCAQFRKLVLAAAVALLVCDPAFAAEPKPYTDPFAYCAAVKDVDAPDARWTGHKLPEAITQGEVSLGLVSADAPPDILGNAVWRCMGGKVYLCSFGANLPCDEKAGTSKKPTPGMNDFCKTTPASDMIPAYITGHATVYDWSCKDGAPVPGKQLVKPDARGFLSNIWHELPPPKN